MSRPYSRIVAEYHRQYPHQVRLRNTGDWRFDHCSRAHYQITRGVLAWWHEEGASMFGFKTADQAAAFQRWADTCGIDWNVELAHSHCPIHQNRRSGQVPMGRRPTRAHHHGNDDRRILGDLGHPYGLVLRHINVRNNGHRIL